MALGDPIILPGGNTAPEALREIGKLQRDNNDMDLGLLQISAENRRTDLQHAADMEALKVAGNGIRTGSARMSGGGNDLGGNAQMMYAQTQAQDQAFKQNQILRQQQILGSANQLLKAGDIGGYVSKLAEVDPTMAAQVDASYKGMHKDMLSAAKEEQSLMNDRLKLIGPIAKGILTATPEQRQIALQMYGPILKQMGVDIGENPTQDKLMALAMLDNSQKKPMSSDAAKTFSNATTGLEALSNVEKLMAEGASTFGAKFVPNMLGTNSPETKQLEASRNSLLQSVGRLYSGGAINKEEWDSFNNLMPNTTDDPETTKYKLGLMRKQLTTIMEKVNPEAAASMQNQAPAQSPTPSTNKYLQARKIGN